MLTLRNQYAPTYHSDVPLLDEELVNHESGEEVFEYMMHEVNHSSIAFD